MPWTMNASTDVNPQHRDNLIAFSHSYMYFSALSGVTRCSFLSFSMPRCSKTSKDMNFSRFIVTVSLNLQAVQGGGDDAVLPHDVALIGHEHAPNICPPFAGPAIMMRHTGHEDLRSLSAHKRYGCAARRVVPDISTSSEFYVVFSFQSGTHEFRGVSEGAVGPPVSVRGLSRPQALPPAHVGGSHQPRRSGQPSGQSAMGDPRDAGRESPRRLLLACLGATAPGSPLPLRLPALGPDPESRNRFPPTWWSGAARRNGSGGSASVTGRMFPPT